MENRLIFVTGGARSGKSRFAQELADGIRGNKVFIATAEALDEEMQARIEIHKQERPSGWDTIEEPRKLSRAIMSCDGKYEVVLIDCVTLWVSNLLANDGFTGQDIVKELKTVLNTSKSIKATVIMVSNEVGSGIVPDKKLSRLFRDIIGNANQEMSFTADEVYLVVAGMPLKLKGKTS